jgi:peptidoglycan/xylan/chitin deacetylase (PgdA/CDA1 family)
VPISLAVHAASAGALFLAPERWHAPASALLINQLTIAWGTMWPRSRLLGANITRLSPPTAGRVALTFDDGPDPEVTPAVLDLLEDQGATASFFFVGRKVDAHPALAAEVQARGHTVENHSYSHSNTFALRGPASLEHEVLRAQEAIERATGRSPAYFRAPAGIRNLWLEPCLRRARLALVSWTRRGFDTVTGNASRVANRLTRGNRAGDILLLHDGSSAKDAAGRPVVLAALPLLLEALARQSLRATSLPRAA